MGRANSADLAWRVVIRWHELCQSVEQICDRETGLGVSRHYVGDVLDRFAKTGDVATHQGLGADPLARRALSRLENFHIVQLVLRSPRASLKEHRAQFVLETGVLISYGAFCRALRDLGYTRKKVRTLAYELDEDRAREWLRCEARCTRSGIASAAARRRATVHAANCDHSIAAHVESYTALYGSSRESEHGGRRRHGVECPRTRLRLYARRPKAKKVQKSPVHCSQHTGLSPSS